MEQPPPQQTDYNKPQSKRERPAPLNTEPFRRPGTTPSDDEAFNRLLPIASAQRGMWMGEKIGPSDAVYKLAEYVDIGGDVDVPTFLKASQLLTKEAESTRVQIVETAEGARQLVNEQYPGEFPFLDFSAEDDAEAHALRWMNDEVSRPVDLEREALWLGVLIKLSEQRYFWYQRCHHITLDGFGGGLLARRLADIYNGLLAGGDIGESPLLPLVQQLEEEKAYRESSRIERDRDYWKSQLAGLPDAISLSQRSAPRSGGLRRSALVLSLERSAQLRDIAQQAGGSVPQLLISMLAAYTYRMSGQQDLVFGMPVTARVNRRLRSIPSMMANAVAIRLAMGDEQSLVELLGQTAKVVRSALRHQQYRYEELRRDLGLLGSGQQISWMGVNIEPFDYDFGFGGHHCSIHNLSNGTVEDMTVFVFDRGEKQGLHIVIDANPALYSQLELDEHRDRLGRLVEAMIQAPNSPIGDFDLLSADERRSQLQAWNDTESPLPAAFWPGLFEQSVAHFADRPVLSDASAVMSYRELADQVNPLCQLLRERGIGPGKVVAVALPRENCLPTALLAILKSGAAYLPLDPGTPAERVAMILEDARPDLILSSKDCQQGLPDTGVPCLLWESLTLSDYPARALPDVAIAGDMPAYIIYTSGSTGRPKGVVVPHLGLQNFLLAMQQSLSLTPDDSLLALTTVSFDIAVLELFLPMLAGARVHIASRDIARDPAALAAVIAEQGITTLQATPSHWQALLEEHGDVLQGIRPLVGGEALPTELAHRMRRLGQPLVNLYGPTETTIWSTMMILDKIGNSAPPIGRPIANTQVYVLDEKMALLPPGVPGELYIGGAGVALGYHNRPDLTAERFVDNPYGEGRLYKTGDQARWRRDGVLEYLGRNDFQIKIRGFRVETEEIETHLLRCVGVRRAAVALRKDPAGQPRLVAYLLPEEGFDADSEALQASALRLQIETSLPDYMLPSHYELVSDLPLNVNGKLDRKALPEPHWQCLSEYTAPRTPLEEKLAELWCEIFQLDRIGVHDSFFDLGADSLTAARMVARLRLLLGRDVPLAAAFEATTIAELAEHLQRGSQLDPLACCQTLNTAAARHEGEPLFCIHPVLGLSWGFAGLGQYLGKDTALYGLQSRGLDGQAELPGSIEEVAADYIFQLRQIQPSGPYRLLGWSMGGIVAQEMARQLRDSGESVGFLGVLDAYPFKLENGASEAEVALGIVDFLGLDAARAPASMAEMSDFLCREYDVLNMDIVKGLQDQHSNLLEDVAAVIANNLSLLQGFAPGAVDVPMHFFQALDTARSESIQHCPSVWHDKVAGLHVHPVNCHHQAMLEAGPLAEIGPQIAAALLSGLREAS